MHGVSLRQAVSLPLPSGSAAKNPSPPTRLSGRTLSWSKHRFIIHRLGSVFVSLRWSFSAVYHSLEYSPWRFVIFLLHACQKIPRDYGVSRPHSYLFFCTTLQWKQSRTGVPSARMPVIFADTVEARTVHGLHHPPIRA